MKFFDLHFRSIYGEDVKFSDYTGKVCLVINIASHCGFTPQLHDMETLYLYYKNKGFEILAFPSNDYANQEPLKNNEIEEFCKDKFVATFPIFEKSHVTGTNINPIFRFLTDKKLNGKVSVKPLWNFQKYLIDREGNVSDFFFTFTKPTAMRLRKKLESLL